jgi:hypothetical protein
MSGEKQVINVDEASEGWYVTAVTRAGPFLNLERAMDLAWGMQAAMRSTGIQTKVAVQSKSANQAAPARINAKLLRGRMGSGLCRSGDNSLAARS